MRLPQVCPYISCPNLGHYTDLVAGEIAQQHGNLDDLRLMQWKDQDGNIIRKITQAEYDLTPD
jgi:hypothetical protein